jgi:biopolymer transport protein TolQ
METNILSSILSASIVVKLTLLILIAMSVSCWTIAFYKWLQLKRLDQANQSFLKAFENSKSLDEIAARSKEFRHSGLNRIFIALYGHWNRSKNSISTNLDGAARKAIDAEVIALESQLSLLASTGSTGPFIGLFGTVWGIMGSFHKIGTAGSASLAVVAPGISEALVATAIGLAAAIPAVILYNYFLAKLRRSESQMVGFAEDFLDFIKQNSTEGNS